MNDNQNIYSIYEMFKYKLWFTKVKMGKLTELIKISEKNKKSLEKKKIHPREPFNEVITKLLKKNGEKI